MSFVLLSPVERDISGLQAIYDKYKDKDFVILGFPCNQVGSHPSLCPNADIYIYLWLPSLVGRNQPTTPRSPRSVSSITE